MILISLTFLALAAICNALIDVISFHFYQSIFSTRNQYIWNPTYSWRSKYIDGNPDKGRIKWHIWSFYFNKPLFFCDAWHRYKSLMIICLCLSIVTFQSLEYQLLSGCLDSLLYAGVYGTLWNMIFNLFYNRVFVRKT